MPDILKGQIPFRKTLVQISLDGLHWHFGILTLILIFWNLINICSLTCVMIQTSYFGKLNSTFGSVVPLAMFLILFKNLLTPPIYALLFFSHIWQKCVKEVQLASVGLKTRWGNSQNGMFVHKHANFVNFEVIFWFKIFQNSFVGWPKFGTNPIRYQYFDRLGMNIEFPITNIFRLHIEARYQYF